MNRNIDVNRHIEQSIKADEIMNKVELKTIEILERLKINYYKLHDDFIINLPKEKSEEYSKLIAKEIGEVLDYNGLERGV